MTKFYQIHLCTYACSMCVSCSQCINFEGYHCADFCGDEDSSVLLQCGALTEWAGPGILKCSLVGLLDIVGEARWSMELSGHAHPSALGTWQDTWILGTATVRPSDLTCVAMFQTLQETREQLERKLDMRRKQFHVLVASIHQLQAMLDDSETEEIMDVALGAFDDDASDSQKVAPPQPEPMFE